MTYLFDFKKFSGGVALMSTFFLLSSCGGAEEQPLVLLLSPVEALVVETPRTFSCKGRFVAARASNIISEGDVSGPLVAFNRMSMEWKKSNKVYIHSAKITFTGSGIAGGEARCDLTEQLFYLFEDPLGTPTTPDNTNADASIFESGAFLQAGTVVSNPHCRIPCTIPLADPNVPEINASGILVVKGTEVLNEGEINEVNFRVRSQFTVRIRP